ncbi:hypothetical protein LTS10_007792 [Elasticomyces elasticus]|nr:hypothetical protein LTS10_007792 [Elasticomyces elasticus]
MSAVDLKKSYLRVKEDYGGTFNAQDRVGTYGCIFCVGIYFQIGSSKASCAHIHPRSDGNGIQIFPSEAEGAKLKSGTVKRLTSHAKENGWSAETVDKASVVMVCPLPDHATNVAAGCQSKHHAFAKRPGWYVIEGIKEFLGLAPSFKVDTESQGFVVDGGKDQPVIKVPFDTGDPEFEDVRVEALKDLVEAEAGGDRNWNCEDWDLDGDE